MRMPLKRTRYMLMVPALVTVLGASAATAQASGGDSWPTAGYDIGNTRDAASELAIGPGNVSGLTPAWSLTTAGDVRTTPAVSDGVVYFPDFGGKLWAVSEATGSVVWSTTIASYTGLPPSPVTELSRVTPAVYGNELILGETNVDGAGAWVLGIDKNNGQLLWKTEVDTHPAAIITSSAVVHNGVAYLGVSSYEEMLAEQPGYQCCTHRGSVIALNANTGQLLWQTYTVPVGYSGGAVWGSTPALDPALNLLYVGTGPNYSVPAGVCAEPGQTGCTPPAADDHFDSVLALNMTTGALVWSRATLSGDAYISSCGFPPVAGCGPDYDFGSGPNIIQLPSGRTLIGAGQKSGIYWALDPLTGAVVWDTQVGPGSAYGGIQWGSATDGKHVFVAIANAYAESYQITSASGQVTTTSGGSWAELDAATGKILWQVADPQQAADLGYVTIANGLMYVGSTADTGDDMFVLNETDGSILWSFNSGGPVISGPAILGNTVYWGSGNDLATRCPGGSGPIEACKTSNDKFYAFRLP